MPRASHRSGTDVGAAIAPAEGAFRDWRMPAGSLAWHAMRGWVESGMGHDGPPLIRPSHRHCHPMRSRQFTTYAALLGLCNCQSTRFASIRRDSFQIRAPCRWSERTDRRAPCASGRGGDPFPAPPRSRQTRCWCAHRRLSLHPFADAKDHGLQGSAGLAGAHAPGIPRDLVCCLHHSTWGHHPP